MYTTINGDTWECISYKIYGTSYNVGQLIGMNPECAMTYIFPAGVTLNVPVISPVPSATVPWKEAAKG